MPLTVTVGSAVYRVTTDDWGRFSLRDLEPGTYDIRVKNMHTLGMLKSGLALTVGTNTIDFGMLSAGDADGNNCVNIIAFSMLANWFNPQSDGRADFNEDGMVNISDFSLGPQLCALWGHRGVHCRFARFSRRGVRCSPV